MSVVNLISNLIQRATTQPSRPNPSIPAPVSQAPSQPRSPQYNFQPSVAPAFQSITPFQPIRTPTIQQPFLAPLNLPSNGLEGLPGLQTAPQDPKALPTPQFKEFAPLPIYKKKY